MSIFQRIAEGSTRATTMFERLGIDEEAVLGSDPIQAGNELRRRALGALFAKAAANALTFWHRERGFPKRLDTVPTSRSLTRWRRARPI